MIRRDQARQTARLRDDTALTFQALGGNGYINDYAAGRLLRDAKLYEIGAGTQEIRRMLIGRELFEAAA